METVDLRSSLGLVSEKYDIPALNSLKPEQVEALQKLVDNRHVMTILPTGYGKSVIFALLPLILDEVSKEQ